MSEPSTQPVLREAGLARAVILLILAICPAHRAQALAHPDDAHKGTPHQRTHCQFPLRSCGASPCPPPWDVIPLCGSCRHRGS